MMKMTRDLITNNEQIMTDAHNLYKIGAVCDSMGQTESFDRYFHETYELDTEAETDGIFGILGYEFMTDEQKSIYDEYTAKVARELFRLQHNR